MIDGPGIDLLPADGGTGGERLEFSRPPVRIVYTSTGADPTPAYSNHVLELPLEDPGTGFPVSMELEDLIGDAIGQVRTLAVLPIDEEDSRLVDEYVEQRKALKPRRRRPLKRRA